MSYNPTEIFTRLGVYVHWWYQLGETKAALAIRLEEAIADFNIRNVGCPSDTPSDADVRAYEALSVEARRQQEVVDSMHDSIVRAASDFLEQNVSGLIGLPEQPPADVLDALIACMGRNSDTVMRGGRFYTFVEENFQKELPTATISPTISDEDAGAEPAGP